jgi:hypothetical protein
MNQFKHMAGLFGQVINPSQRLCLDRTAQHRKTRTNIHGLSWIRTRNPSIEAAKTHAIDCEATEIAMFFMNYIFLKIRHVYLSFNVEACPSRVVRQGVS